MAERVLIVTPAGLRDQWAAELSERFGDHARRSWISGMCGTVWRRFRPA